MGFQSRPMMAPLSRTTSSQPTVPSNSLDVRSRLSFSTGSALGIRDHMNNLSTSRPERESRNPDAWTTTQTTWPTTNWSYTSTQAYTMPPTSSSYELTSGRPTFSEVNYPSSHQPLPSPGYSMGSGNHSQTDPSNLRGSDPSFLLGSHSLSPLHGQESNTTDVGQHGLNSAHHFDFSSFAPASGMATGGSDPFVFRGIGEDSRGFPVTTGSELGDHYG
jgi:hypothetical protein